MKHIIITRYCLNVYSDNIHGIKDVERWMEERFKLFQDTKQSIMKARDNAHKYDVEWWLCFDRNTPIEWIDKICTEDWMIPKYKRPPHLTFPEGWKMTTRIDSDDLMHEGFIEHVQEVAEEGNELLIDVKYMHGVKESQRRFNNSMFLTLVNNNPNKCVYDGEHSNMHLKYKSTRVPFILAKHRRHGGNLFRKQGDNWIK